MIEKALALEELEKVSKNHGPGGGMNERAARAAVEECRVALEGLPVHIRTDLDYTTSEEPPPYEPPAAATPGDDPASETETSFSETETSFSETETEEMDPPTTESILGEEDKP